ncbi:MAG: hypothetical protein KGL39_32720 [Patescibacteria group bacterium]|nr:hypothetical protein [Patescibacteria group bacterium]
MRNRTLHLHPSRELLAEVEWLAPFLRSSPHAFCLAAVREKLAREREANPDIPERPAGFYIPRDEGN